MGGALSTEVFPPPLLPVAAHHGVVACRSQLAVQLVAELHRCTSGLHPTQLARIVQQATENKAPLENEALLESLFDISHLVGGWVGGWAGGRAGGRCLVLAHVPSTHCECINALTPHF